VEFLSYFHVRFDFHASILLLDFDVKNPGPFDPGIVPLTSGLNSAHMHRRKLVEKWRV